MLFKSIYILNKISLKYLANIITGLHGTYFATIQSHKEQK